jgi:glucosamine--fructose-6-phosphate aminotransferase (isomerizing)
VIVNIQRQPGANIIDVVDSVKALLPQIEASLPAAVQVHVLTDRTLTIRASIEGVQHELLLTIALGRQHGMSEATELELVAALESLPGKINAVLELNEGIAALAEHFVNKQHALYLGRGTMFPIAMEGALKLKEISYIHAEAYPAGELKHGPLALVDDEMPVIAVAPRNDLLEKLKSNLEEVRARGGQLYIFADSQVTVSTHPAIHVMSLPAVHEAIAPVVYTVPLQLLAYHVAVLKGADVDQPRNLAKSVTVE